MSIDLERFSVVLFAAAVAGALWTSACSDSSLSADGAAQTDSEPQKKRPRSDAGADSGTSLDATAPVDAGADSGAPADAGVGCSVSDTSGPQYYVSTTGSDSNPGTLAAPWATLQHAADVAHPGDTIIVEDGTYTTSALLFVSMSNGGTSSAPITFRSQNKWGAKLNGNRQTRWGMYIAGSGYIRIQDFEIYGLVASTNDGAGALMLHAPNLDVVGNLVHDIGRQCTDTTYGVVGIYAGHESNNLTVERNVFHDIGRLGAGENGCNPSTGYYQNHDHGVYFSGMSGVRVINNTFYNLQHGWGIQVYPDATSNVLIANNTFAGANPWRDGQVLLAANLASSTIANNIFYEPRSYGVSFDNAVTFTGVAIANNLTYPGTIAGGATAPGMSFSGNIDATDPQLVSPSTYDFHLQSSSPAIDTGTTVSAVTQDFACTPRPQGAAYDIGAFER